MAFGGLKGTLTGNGNSITASNSIAGSVSVAVGDLVFAVLGQQTNLTATTASDNLGNTYTATNAGTDAGAATGRAYYSRVTVAGTLTSVAIVASASTNDWAGFAAVIEGPFQASPLDKNIANGTADLTSPFTCPATGTLTQADEVIMCWMASDGSATWSATSPNLKAGQVANSTNIKVIIGYQAVSSTSTVSPEFTGTNPTVDVLGTSTFMKDLTQALTPSLYTNTNSFYTPTVLATYALTASLLTNTNTFYTPTVLSIYPLTSALLTNTNSFFTPTVTPGEVILTASLFSNTNTFYTGVLSLFLTPDLFSNTNSFFSPDVSSSYTLTAGLFSNTNTFFTPAVSSRIDLFASLFTNDSQFFSPSILAEYTLTPSFFTNTNSIFASDVLSVYGLSAALLSNTNSFFSETVTPGEVALFPPVYSNTNVLFIPVVLNKNELTEGTFSNTNTFFSATISTTGSGELFPSLFVNTNQFFNSLVSGEGDLTMATYANDGSLNVSVSDGTPKGHYDANGRLRVTIATTEKGLIAPDGSWYVEIDTVGTSQKGFYNSRGNMNVCKAPVYGTQGMYYKTGAVRCTGLP